MKKIVLLSFVTLITSLLWASDPSSSTQWRLAKKAGTKASSTTSKYSRNNKPKHLRSASFQVVPIGVAGNLLTVGEANCHQLDVDSTLNTVVFIHRSDTLSGKTFTGTNFSIAQFRFDISKDGGNTWTNNVGPLNPNSDNIDTNGRYPQLIIRADSAYPTNPDSAWLVYNGSWWTGSGLTVWPGPAFGVGRLDGDTNSYTEHFDTINNSNTYISTSLVESTPGHYWAMDLDYSPESSTQDTVRGIIIEQGVWNDAAGEVVWTYQDIQIGSALVYDANGTYVGNNLGLFSSPVIAFDPTGQYGWILTAGDLTNDNNYSTRPIYMNSTDYGQTWSAPQSLDLDNLPGMFPTNSTNLPNFAKSLVGSIQLAVDSAGNPHIFAVVGQADTTNNQYDDYPFDEMVLYDLYYNPTVPGCSWQANYLSRVYGLSADYTEDDFTADNRVQVSQTKDGKKIFVFWTDTDSSYTASNTDVNNTNLYPNLFGIGIDMGIRQITDVVNFTAGNSLFGGEVPSQNLTTGTYGGALFPVISTHVLNLGGGTYNIPVVLSDPDYLQSVISNKESTNPAAFYYGQNVNFTQSQFVNRFDNAPPTLTVNGPDTVFVHLDSPYVHPSATAYDCVYGAITPQYSSNVPTDINGNTDSVGVYLSTWTATNPLGNTATVTQTVIVAAAPIARMNITLLTAYYRFAFTDTSLNFPTNRTWYWGDGTTNNLNEVHATKVYTSGGVKCIVLKAWNLYGTSYDTVCINTYPEGINNVELSNKINVYPNPSSGIINIDVTDDIAEGFSISTYNMLGQQVNEKATIKSGITQTTLDLGNLETGVYMLKIETTSGTAVKQVTISK